jgi:hypothetical protein
MKNLLFGLIATVLFAFNGNAQEFKKLYENYKNATVPFYKNLNEFEKNLNTEFDNVTFLESEESFKKWLSENVSKTNFKNEQQALTEYKNLMSMSSEIVNNNIDFFKQIGENKKEFLGLLQTNPIDGIQNPPKDNTQEPVTNSPCTFGCINDAVDCSREADTTYAETLAAGWLGGGPLGAAVAMYFGGRAHRRALKLCANTLESCVAGC